MQYHTGKSKYGNKVLLDPGIVNYQIYSSLKKGVEVLSSPNPTERMKAVKNATEISLKSTNKSCCRLHSSRYSAAEHSVTSSLPIWVLSQ